MGRLHYGGGTEPIELPDHTLAHLRVLVTTKLRRSESFAVAWRHGEGDSAGRSSIWLHCSIPLRFDFDSAEPVQIDRDLLAMLSQKAMATGTVDLDLIPVVEAPMVRRHLERAA